jgi:hypothetical protein
MRFGWSSKESSKRVMLAAGIFSLVFTLAYAAIYWFEPFSDFWNNFFSNFFSPVASFIGAVFATLIWAGYEKTDAPRKVWGAFAVGLWLWLAAEISWGYLNMTVGEAPIGIPDVFWIIAYFFLGQALFHQYRIVARPTARELQARMLWVALSLIALTLLVYAVFISGADTPDRLIAAVNSFYPAADLMLAVVAIWLARNFTGGAFSRPWLGLLAFAFADLLYAWLDASGMYAWSLQQGNLLTTVADVAYLAAYLLLGLGVLYQWLFLRYGLRSRADAR